MRRRRSSSSAPWRPCRKWAMMSWPTHGSRFSTTSATSTANSGRVDCWHDGFKLKENIAVKLELMVVVLYESYVTKKTIDILKDTAHPLHKFDSVAKSVWKNTHKLVFQYCQLQWDGPVRDRGRGEWMSRRGDYNGEANMNCAASVIVMTTTVINIVI